MPLRQPSSSRSSLSIGRYRASRSKSFPNGNSENAVFVQGGNSDKLQHSTLGGALGDVTNRALASVGAAENQTKADSQMEPKPLLGAPILRQHAQTEPLPAPDIAQIDADACLAEDPQQVIEYTPDILCVLRRVEMLDAPSPSYIDRQLNVNAKMRGILMDWLVAVQQKYKLKAETLFLAVNLIDRYLTLKATARRNLQLVGVTALLIAAKFEEIHPPHVSDMVTVTDKAYTRQDIINMEVTMLGALDFKICKPTPMQFFERYQRVNGCTEIQRDLAQYLLELTLVDYSMIKYSPSHLAAAAVLLSSKLMRRQPSWPAAAVKDSHFTEQMLKECAKEMCPLLENAEHSSLQAVRKKFSQSKYHAVAKLSFSGTPSTAEAAPLLAPVPRPQSAVSRPSLGGERRQSLGGNELPMGRRLSTSNPSAPPH